MAASLDTIPEGVAALAAIVSPKLVEKHIRHNRLVAAAWSILQDDEEVNTLLRMANINAVVRLLYNDHGPVHARIVAGSALEIMDILLEAGVKPSSLEHGTVSSIDEAKLIVLLGAYLHDIGNAIHRSHHEFAGAIISLGILDRLLPKILGIEDGRRIGFIKYEVAHAIYATAQNVPALTVEASIVKVADATDMAEGRARYPYKKGKTNMHALSALAIKRVELDKGEERPLRINVYMTERAGYFQLEQVLIPKVKTSMLTGMIEIQPIVINNGREEKQAIIKP